MNPLIKKIKFRPGKDWIYYAPDTRYVFDRPEKLAVQRALEKGWLGTGQITANFEAKVANIFGKKYGLFVNSGSSANLLALEALAFPKGSEVITPACTFNTTIAPIVQNRLVPVLVDVEASTYQIDINEMKKALSKKTVAVLAPHLIGNFVELNSIRNFCKKNKLIFIEDSCDTLGGLHKEKRSGAWSDITTTSFYASHIITTAGAGGMLMTNDKKIIERARVFASWGRGIKGYLDPIDERLSAFMVDGKPYDSAFAFVQLGYNFRPTEVQAAFGLAQLKRLKGFGFARRANFRRLMKFFKKYEDYFILPKEQIGSEVHWLAFPLTIKSNAPFKRSELVTFLEKRKIQTRPIFSGNILKHEAYKATNHRVVGKLPNSQEILHNGILLGLHHTLTKQMLEYICSSINEFLEKKI